MDSLTFWSGTATALTTSLIVVVYLRSHLRGLLTELCGTQRRGDFWVAFSNVVLILMPLVFSLDGIESVQGQPASLAIAEQIRKALIGLVVTVMSIGVVLSMFVARVPAQHLQPPAKG